MMYGKRSNGNNHGLVITKPLVVEKMLDRVGYVSSCNLSDIKITEPSAGDGAYALEIIKRLYESSVNFDFCLQDALSNVKLFEIDEEMVGFLSVRIDSFLKGITAFRPETMIVLGDFLLSTLSPCDILIGNPPYVRHENIPEELKATYRKLFRNFTHRSDLYVAFFEKGLRSLKQNGRLSFITSNRWLKNQYGKNLRDFISNNYSLLEVIDLENTSPFEEEVLAYPAITLIKKTSVPGIPRYIHLNTIDDLGHLTNEYKHNRVLNMRASNWFAKPINGDAYEKYLDTILNQGFKIGIGVATGCDRVFIRNDFQKLVENELLLPILISKDLKGDKLKWSGNFILNPFHRNGELIDLNRFPKAKAYLLLHQEALKNRHVAKKNPNNWYKTIDKIQTDLTFEDKILLPDLSGNKSIFIDKGEFYPHHNLYYITGKSKVQLVLLAAILTSDFVRIQLSEFGNKMNGGYARWQSQNLKKLRVPIIDAIPKSTADKIIRAYHENNITEINRLITPVKISEYELTEGQMTLFEPEELY